MKRIIDEYRNEGAVKNLGQSGFNQLAFKIYQRWCYELNNVYLTDEVCFILSGYINFQKLRIWWKGNPRIYRGNTIHPEKIEVWFEFRENE